MGQNESRHHRGEREAHRYEDGDGGRPSKSKLWAGVPDDIQWLVRRKVSHLSGADGVMLLSRHGEGGLSQLQAGEAMQPSLHQLEPSLAVEALAFDPYLQGVRDRLVPHLVPDAVFWDNYFSHVDGIKHELTLDYFRALSNLNEQKERLHALWVSTWRELPEEDRVDLKRVTDTVAQTVLHKQRVADAELAADDDDYAGSEYGEYGAYEAARVILKVALEEGLTVCGMDTSAKAPFDEALYRVWCCSERLRMGEAEGMATSPRPSTRREGQGASPLPPGSTGGPEHSAMRASTHPTSPSMSLSGALPHRSPQPSGGSESPVRRHKRTGDPSKPRVPLSSPSADDML
mmetsp:Transcript_14120/g.42769  ORF Transcript_14120/g.42769 Transcript_14120/m.42769 type:complete len:346 (+) Transcript_14120:77-1114(+)